MARQTVIYLHGFASSPQGSKASYLRKKFEALPEMTYAAIDFSPTASDFEYVTTTGLINRLRQYLLDHEARSLRLIGSSFGGLVALHYAHRFGGVERMLLLAPGLFWLSAGMSEHQLARWKSAGAVPVFHEAVQQDVAVRYDLHADGLRYLEPVPPPTPILIIHGRNDRTVPIEHSRSYAAQYPGRVRLIEVEADHDLNAHLDLIWQHVQSFLLQTD